MTETNSESVSSSACPLLASVWDGRNTFQNILPTGLTGTITFIISGAGIEGETFTLNLTNENQGEINCHKQWMPKGEGAATITAIYSGDDTYAPSTATVNVYFVLNRDGRSALSLTAPANVTYGESANISATLTEQKDSGNGRGTSTNVTGDETCTFTIEMLVNGKYEDITRSSSDYDHPSDTYGGMNLRFKRVTNYRITATYTNPKTKETLTDSKVIAVNKGTATLSAANTAHNLNDTDRAPKAAVLTGLASWDNSSLTEADYTLTTEGTAATTPGEYPIYIALKDTEPVKALQEKYNILLKNATYKLNAVSHMVTATGDANGSVSITYQADASSATLPVTSGTALPAGSKVTFTAHPRTGYTVSKWTVNGSDEPTNNAVYTIDSLDRETTVSATFTAGTSTLTYASNNTAQGTVTANYLSGGNLGTVFTSGGNVNYNQSIRVTAAPLEGYAIDYWTVNGETLKTADGANNFTGTTYDFSSFTGNTTVTVYFTANSKPTVTIRPVDNNGEPLPAAKVSVGGTELTGNDGVFTHTGSTGENPVITVTPPDGLLVDSWTATTGTAGTLSSDKCVMTLRDLRVNTEFTVKCMALNSYTVSFESKLLGNSGSANTMGTLSAAKVGTSGTLTSGGNQLQGSTILFTAEPKEGYEIVGWTLNGKPVTPTVNGNTQTYRIEQLSENIDLVVTFRKLPEVQLAMDRNGTLTCGSHTSDFYLPYGSKDALTFTAEPKEGYRVKSWMLNSEPVTGQAVTNSDSQTYTYTPDQTNGLTADTVVSVTFEKIPTATVTFSVRDAGEGAHGTLSATATRYGTNTDLTSGGAVLSGSTVKFTAAPANGYKVFKWFLNGEEQTTMPEFTIADTDKGKTYDVQVQFTRQSSTIHYGITSDSDAGHGAKLHVTFYRNGMSQPDPIANGTSVTETGTLTAKVEDLKDGYEVAGWTLDGAPYEPDGEAYTGDTLTCDVSATKGADIAVKLIRKSYTVKFSAQEGGNITVSPAIASGDAVKGDTEITFTAAAPQSGYTFAGWKVNGTMQETNDMTYTLTVTENAEVVACYELADAEYTVAYKIVGDAKGTVNVSVNGKPLAEDGKVQAGSEVVFTAVPNADYMVENWFADEACTNPIGTAESATYTIPRLAGNATVYVRFTCIPMHILDVQSIGAGTVEVSGNGSSPVTVGTGEVSILHHTSVLLTAKPSGSAYLQSWTLDGKEMPVNETLTLRLDDVTGDHTIKATFGATQMVNLKTTCGAGGTLTVTNANGVTLDASKGIQVPKGSKLTMTATPESGKMVKAWTVNGKTQTELSNTFTLVPTENAEVQVEFENVKLFDLPTDNRCTLKVLSRTPSDYGTEFQIRKNGTIEFVMAPKDGYAIRSLEFDGGTVTRCEPQPDGSWIIRIENVVGNSRGGIGFSGNIYEVSIPLTITAPMNGTLTVQSDAIELMDGAMLNKSEELTITATPDSGYTLDKLTVTGATEQSDGTYWINNNAAEVTVSASFKSTSNVTPGGGGGGGGGGGAVSTYTLTFDTNGGSAIDKITKNSGTTIDLTAYKPTRAGYTFAGWYSDKELTKAVTSVKLTANTTVYAKWTQDGGTTKNPFVDVKEGAYYYDAVLWAVDQKITSGTSATTFSPDASCTRAQMVTFLWRAAGSPKAENTKNPFTDVKADAYYYDAVLWAVEKGVTSGTSATTFSPDATVTRGQTVTFLYRNAGSPDVTGTMPFTDVEADAYYAKAILWAVQQKITTGTSETTFSPANDCARGQIVTFLYRAK